MRMWLLVALCVSLVAARVEGAPILVDAVVLSPFAPVRAEVAALFDDGSAVTVPAELATTKEESGFRTRVGALLAPPRDESSFMFVAVVRGEGGLVRASPLLSRPLAAGELSAESLRQLVVDRREELRTLQGEVEAQRASIERLRITASKIANLSEMVAAQREIESLIDEEARLRRLQVQLGRFVAQASQVPVPAAVTRREQELTAWGSELAQIVRESESQEFSRRRSSEEQLRNQLSRIAENRDVDVAALEERVAELERQLPEVSATTPKP